MSCPNCPCASCVAERTQNWPTIPKPWNIEPFIVETPPAPGHWKCAICNSWHPPGYQCITCSHT